MRYMVIGAILAVLIAACGGTDEESTTTSEASSTTPPTVAATTSTTTAPTATTASATTTTTAPVDVTFQGGVVTGPGRITAAIGDDVSVWVLSDVDAEIHVHGYDLLVPATAGTPVEIALTADVPGIFEVEVEGSHTVLFELEVGG